MFGNYPPTLMLAAVINRQLLWVLAAGFAVLTVGSLIRVVALRRSAEQVVRSRLASLGTWWVLAIALALAALLGEMGAIVLLAAASLLGMREFLTIEGVSLRTSPLAWMAMTMVVVHYVAVAMGGDERVYLVLCLALLFGLSVLGSSQGMTHGYVKSLASVFWGFMLLVVALSYAALLFRLPSDPNGIGAVGWFLLVVVLTECNDIAQALVGRRIGKHRITPQVSPNKSWEGFLGGLATTVVLAILLAGVFTPLAATYGWLGGSARAAALGAILSIAGFFGDINMSAIKRDAGVKDGSHLLPGQGGAIDRVDSLVFTAPVSYYMIQGLLALPG